MTATTQECCEQYWTSPRGNTPQSTNCTTIYLPVRKLSKLDEPDMQDIAGEAGTSSWEMYSYGPRHMAEQKQDDQLEHTYSSSMRIRDAAPRTCQKRWTITREGQGYPCWRHDMMMMICVTILREISVMWYTLRSMVLKQFLRHSPTCGLKKSNISITIYSSSLPVVNATVGTDFYLSFLLTVLGWRSKSKTWKVVAFIT